MELPIRCRRVLDRGVAQCLRLVRARARSLTLCCVFATGLAGCDSRVEPVDRSAGVMTVRLYSEAGRLQASFPGDPPQASGTPEGELLVEWQEVDGKVECIAVRLSPDARTPELKQLVESNGLIEEVDKRMQAIGAPAGDVSKLWK